MATESKGFLVLPGRVAEAFPCAEKLSETPAAEAFRVSTSSKADPEIVWVTRRPIAVTDIDRFCARLAKLRGFRFVAPILQFGVDSERYGYAVVKHVSRVRLDDPSADAAERDRRYSLCVNLVERLHELGVTCGDLSPSSFVVTRTGDVVLLAPLGVPRFDNGVTHDGSAESSEPGSSTAGSDADVDEPADMRDLCKIGEKLTAMAGVNRTSSTNSKKNRIRRPTSENIMSDLRLKAEALTARLAEEKKAIPVEAVGAVGGVESDKVIGGRDQEAASESSVKVTAHSEVKERSLMQKPVVPAETQSAGGRKQSSGIGKAPEKQIKQTAHVAAAQKKRRVVFVLTGLNIAALAFLAVILLNRDSISAPANEAVVMVGQKEQAQMTRWVMSDDPLVQGVLEKAFREADSPRRREYVFNGMVTRSRRMGLVGASDVVRMDAYQRGMGPESAQSPALMLGLKLLDPSKSDSARKELLISGYDLNPSLATRLAAALALDRGHPEMFHEIFVRAVHEQLGFEGASTHNDLALMLLLPEVHDLFSESIVQQGASPSAGLPPQEISWLLEEMGRRERSGIATVAQLAQVRGVASGPGEIFLTELQRVGAVDTEVRASLVSGVINQLSKENVQVLAAWNNPASVRALQAVILTSSDNEMVARAYEALRSKPLGDGYVSGILEFVEASFRGDSGRYSFLIAALALRNTVSKEVLAQALSRVEVEPANQAFAQQIIRDAPTNVVQAALPRFAPILEPTDIIDLLSHPDPVVRAQAVGYLSEANDILLLKLIQQAYEGEQDPVVRRTYEERISIIRDRTQAASVS